MAKQILELAPPRPVVVPPDLHQAIRILASRRGVRIKVLVTQMLRAAVARENRGG